MPNQKHDHSVIPSGPYCYSWAGPPEKGKIKICPFWSKDMNKPEQENGFCSFLDIGDWQGPGVGLLWDMCKECDINQN